MVKTRFFFNHHAELYFIFRISVTFLFQMESNDENQLELRINKEQIWL